MENITRTTIYLLRHGECVGNAEGRFRGRCDFPLNDLGVRQAGWLATAFAGRKLDGLYSSPLRRAVQTAESLGHVLNLPVTRLEALNNIRLGPWEGRLKSEIATEQPDLWNMWLTNPEALHESWMETLDAVADRSFACLNELVRRHQGGAIAVCTHRTVLKPLLARCTGAASPWFWRFHMETASYSTLVHEARRGYILIQLNRTDHLNEFNREWD